ncbi:hypothetical protein [Sphingobacterium lactis]
MEVQEGNKSFLRQHYLDQVPSARCRIGYNLSLKIYPAVGQDISAPHK